MFTDEFSKRPMLVRVTFHGSQTPSEFGDESLGTQLIRTFGQQLHGVPSIHSQKDKGTVAEIVFPDPQKKTAGDAPPAVH